MYSGFSQTRDDVVEPRYRFARLVGAAASAPTVAAGFGFTATHAGTGDYKLTFKENPGRWLGGSVDFESATMVDLAGYTAIFKTYDATNWVVEFTVYNSSFSAADLTTAQVACVYMKFHQSNLETGD